MTIDISGIMTVVGHAPVHSNAPGRFQGLDLVEPLYVGGVRDFGAINRQAGYDHGFVGCISRLVIGSTAHELIRDATTKLGVTTCETCAVNPCHHNGVCQEDFTSTGYKCICMTGFSGLHCERTGELCYQGEPSLLVRHQ